MTNPKKSLRTCIVCREKYEQKELFRLKCEDKKLVPYNNNGRSFYICKDCIKIVQSDIKQKEYKKLEKSLFRECKNKDNYVVQLKEMLTDVR
ncbi:DUF448 domain-containing protein [Poseidonibacter sp.]|uniref:DUF448 domain-containing protein n=1 Tax=Poseidonibacter sp. TaxID=2321188 RepID=UPI00359D95CE